MLGNEFDLNSIECKKFKRRRQIPPLFKGSFHCHDSMKINKKLLMAALAGAIVVGGGVNTYAAEPAPTEGTNDAAGKTDEQKISEAQAKAKIR